MVLKFKSFGGIGKLNLPQQQSTQNVGACTATVPQYPVIKFDPEDQARKQRSDEQRRAALKQREAKWKQNTKLVSDALKQVDVAAVKPQHRRFSDSDSDDDGGVVPLTSFTPVDATKPKPPKSGAVLKLFDDEDNEEGEDMQINIKPHLFGKRGAALMARESAFNGDDRFRLTEKFLDEDNEEEEDVGEVRNHKVTDDVKSNEDNNVVGGKTDSERRAERDVMARVLGKANASHIVTTAKTASSSAGAGMVRFDPSNPQHYQYDLGAASKSSETVEAQPVISKSKRKRKGDSIDSADKVQQPTSTLTESEPVNETTDVSRVDSRRFHEMNMQFADSLRAKLAAEQKGDTLIPFEQCAIQKKSTSPQGGFSPMIFSLLQSLGRTHLLGRNSTRPDDECNNTSNTSFASDLQVTGSLWQPAQSQPTQVRDSLTELNKRPLNEPVGSLSTVDNAKVRFFVDLATLRKEIQNFHCTQSEEEVRKNWEKYRTSLVLSYKRQRKDASRQQRAINQMRDRFGQSSEAFKNATIRPVHHPRQQHKQTARHNLKRTAPWKTWKKKNHSNTSD